MLSTTPSFLELPSDRNQLVRALFCAMLIEFLNVWPGSKNSSTGSYVLSEYATSWKRCQTGRATRCARWTTVPLAFTYWPLASVW